MKQKLAYFVLGLGVLVMGGIAWWFGARTPETTEEPLPHTPEVSEGMSIYASGEHGFLITYPQGAVLEEGYEGPWRSYALPEVASTNILSLTTYRTESESSYPRYYYTIVRVGFSDDAREVRECVSVREGSGETKQGEVLLGDVPFTVFSFGDAGMMQYMKGESYRAVRDGKCYAIERIARGSIYREEPSDSDIAEETLAAEYDKTKAIVESFRFAR